MLWPRDPVVLTASVPRFMAPGDESRLLVQVVHADGPSGDVALHVRGVGIEVGVVPQTLRLAGQKRGRGFDPAECRGRWRSPSGADAGHAGWHDPDQKP